MFDESHGLLGKYPFFDYWKIDNFKVLKVLFLINVTSIHFLQTCFAEWEKKNK